MFWDEELTPEEEEEIIEWTAKEFYKYGMETAAIFFLESYKPMSRIGTSLGTVFFSPLMPIFGDNTAIRSQKVLKLFQEDKNVERLIVRLEEIAKKGLNTESDDGKKKDEKPAKDNEEKKGWRKYLPFL
jgi:hypothetical protein